MMKTLFEMSVTYDIGDAESGMMISTCNDYYDVEINIFQNESDLYNEVIKRYMDEHKDDTMLVACNVVRLVPEVEANVIRNECGMTDTYINECGWF